MAQQQENLNGLPREKLAEVLDSYPGPGRFSTR